MTQQNIQIAPTAPIPTQKNPLDGKSLIIFDIDDTIAAWKTGELLPGVTDWFIANHHNYEIAFATNQGGVGLRYWMETSNFGEPDQYPTAEDANAQVECVISQLTTAIRDSDNVYAFHPQRYICYRYQSRKTGKWCPIPEDQWTDLRWSTDWRKPNPGMIQQALKDYALPTQLALMVGDRDEDQLAASRAGIDFIHADNFFRRGLDGWI